MVIFLHLPHDFKIYFLLHIVIKQKVSGGTLMSSYCIMRIQKIKTVKQMQDAFKHNYRINQPSNADPSLESANREIIPLNGKTYNEVFDDFTKQLGYGPEGKAFRRNGVLALEVLLTFSPEAFKKIDIEKWEKDNMDFLAKSFCTTERNGDNILSAIGHFSESTYHIHSIVIPLKEDRICASEFIDGPAKLRALQDSYAEAMSTHNLQRPIQYSSATHTDIKRFYGELNRALDISIPEWTKDDTSESYQKKVIEDTKDRAAIFLREQKAHETELRKINDNHTNEKRELEKQLKNAKRTIHRYKSEKENFEHEVGSIKFVKKTVEIIRLLNAGLKELDSDEANRITDTINQIVVNQRHRERNRKKNLEKRHKTIFD